MYAAIESAREAYDKAEMERERKEIEARAKKH